MHGMTLTDARLQTSIFQRHSDDRSAAVSALSSVHNLAIQIDADLVMRTRVQKTVLCCFAILCQLHQIHSYMPQPTFQSLVITLVNRA